MVMFLCLNHDYNYSSVELQICLFLHDFKGQSDNEKHIHCGGMQIIPRQFS